MPRRMSTVRKGTAERNFRFFFGNSRKNLSAKAEKAYIRFECTIGATRENCEMGNQTRDNVSMRRRLDASHQYEDSEENEKFQ